MNHDTLVIAITVLIVLACIAGLYGAGRRP